MVIFARNDISKNLIKKLHYDKINIMRSIEQITQIFSKRLKDLIKEKGLNNTTFAAASGLPRTTINGWTEGISIPRADLLDAVADFFNVSIDYLLGREEL